MIAYAGFFDDAGKARSVVGKLGEAGFGEQDVLLIEPASGDDLKKTLSSAKNREFLTATTEARAKAGLEKGRTVVVAKAGLGAGKRVTDILEEAGADMIPPNEDTVGQTKFFSDFIGFPLISEKRSEPDKEFKPGKPITEGFFGLITRPEHPRTTSFGMPLQSKPHPFSRMFGMPLLTKPKATDP